MKADKIREVMKASTSGNKMARIYRALEAVVNECEELSRIGGEKQWVANYICRAIAQKLEIIDE